ncbi:MAG: hypothetical protein QOE70_5413 [Chthoniobacter sp.]|jgi:hypothetical protein|nr:hypothetical protein [Chthoniobacter sp.]
MELLTSIPGAASEVTLPSGSKFRITPLGLDIAEPLTDEEWQDIGGRIGRGLRSMAFVVGDWLVYGETHRTERNAAPREQVPTWLYAQASQLTGLDITTLQNYAYVARRVPRQIRHEKLSWEHHKKVAKLREDAEKTHWLKLAAKTANGGRPMSVRRLARSIQAGRLLSIQEMAETEADTGIENVHPFVNGIVSFFGKLRRGGWFNDSHPEKIEALRRDLLPVVEIYERLGADSRGRTGVTALTPEARA